MSTLCMAVIPFSSCLQVRNWEAGNAAGVHASQKLSHLETLAEAATLAQGPNLKDLEPECCTELTTST